MSTNEEAIRSRLAIAHTEALKVGDSPIRADRLADQLDKLRADLAAADIGEERAARVGGYIDTSLRVLRRDDDGREAARQLQAAIRLFATVAPRPSPFLDD